MVSATEHADDSPMGKLMEATIESVDEFYLGNMVHTPGRKAEELELNGSEVSTVQISPNLPTRLDKIKNLRSQVQAGPVVGMSQVEPVNPS